MNTDTYQREVRRTFPRHVKNDDAIAWMIIGLSGEVGEVANKIKKYLYHNEELHLSIIGEEIGDVMWYVTALCDALNLDLDDCLANNVKKVRDRYPDGWPGNKDQINEG